MNPIPDNNDLDKFFGDLRGTFADKSNVFRACSCTNNPCTCFESELERLDRKYAHIFDELEKG